MGDGRCPMCNAKLIIETVDDQTIVRCTSCTYQISLQTFEKLLDHDIMNYSPQEVIAGVTAYLGREGTTAYVTTACISVAESLQQGDSEEILDGVAALSLSIDQLKIQYGLSDEAIEKHKQIRIKNLLEKSGIL
jgi:hypothetical protein